MIRQVQPNDVTVLVPSLPNSARHRLAIWQFAEQLIAERPILGWGLNNARAVPGGNDKVEVWSIEEDGRLFPMMQPRMPLHPHNMALQIWLETGAVGAVLASIALFRIVMRLGRSARPAGLAAAAAAMSVGLVSFGAWQAWWLASLWLFSAFSIVVLRADSADIAKPSQPLKK